MCLMVLRVRISRVHHRLIDDSTRTPHFRPEVSVELVMDNLQSSDTVKLASSVTEIDTDEAEGDKRRVVI